MMGAMPLPQMPAQERLAHLRADARAARRLALVVFGWALVGLPAMELLGEMTNGRAKLTFAVGALALFGLALPGMALTQLVWWRRALLARRLERALFDGSPTRTARAELRQLGGRLVVSLGWALVVLLGFASTLLLEETGYTAAVDAVHQVNRALTLVAYLAAAIFLVWWARGVLAAAPSALRGGLMPADPWDPRRDAGRLPLAGRTVTAAIWTGTGVLVVLLLAARAHVWEPSAPALGVLLAAAIAAVLGCGLDGWWRDRHDLVD